MASTIKKSSYQTEIQQMMFVLGETKEPLDETSLLVEDIARRQITEIIAKALHQAHRRGSRFITTEDLIFLIRKNKEKCNRLRIFLSWKDVRKNVKDKEAPAFDEVMEDVMLEKEVRTRQKMIKFSWELLAEYTNNLKDDDKCNDGEVSAFEEQEQRLKRADDTTRTMTKEEYLYYAECRAASFTFKKVKRFTEWCEMKRYYETKANSDVVDILGFFAFEIIRRLTEFGLDIKKEWDARGIMKADTEKETLSLFTRQHSNQTPLQPIHIQEAFRRLQRDESYFTNHRGFHRTPSTCI